MVKETALYELVGATPDASPQEIRRAYRKTALKCHPDRGGDTKEFQRLQEAYATLYDAEKRRVYDEFGEAGLKDDGFDLSGMRFEATLTKEDIEGFCKRYRFGDMELEDLTDCFNRLSGDVVRVLEYVPYSDKSDLKRFIEIFDGLMESTSDEIVKKKYARARKVLLKRCRKVKQRVEDDFQMEQGVSEGEGDTIEDDNDDNRGKKKGKKKKEEDDMAEIMTLMKNRNAQRESSFNSLIERLEEKAKNGKGKAKKATKKKGVSAAGRVKKSKSKDD